MVQDNITRYINNINELLVSHENMVKLDAHGNLLSRAVLSEIFYCDFLNALMGWRLENANIERKNAPGIDLIDATNKVAAQVSLTCDHEKIQSSIDIFDKNWSRGSSVWHFYFVPLSDRVPDFKVDFDIPAGIVFDKSTDVLTKDPCHDAIPRRIERGQAKERQRNPGQAHARAGNPGQAHARAEGAR